MAGVRVVQAFNQEDVVPPPVPRDERAPVSRPTCTPSAITAKYTTMIELAQGGAIALILFYGGWLTGQDVVTVGTLAAFVLYLQNLFEPIQQMSQLFNTIQAAGASLQKLYGLLDEPVDDRRAAGRGRPPGDGRARGRRRLVPVRATVRSSSTTCRSPSQPGQRLALGRPDRRREVDAREADGAVLRPGRRARCGTAASTCATRRSHSLRRAHRRRAAGGLPVRRHDPRQPAHRRPDATDADDRRPRSTRSTSTTRFAALPDGLDTEVHERGANFSAGERQLVSLVRAALADPAVVVLDEATSSLDPGTELLVEHALERLMEGRTVIVIAHRLSTAERADLVAVVQDGTLRRGRHARRAGRARRPLRRAVQRRGPAAAPALDPIYDPRHGDLLRVPAVAAASCRTSSSPSSSATSGPGSTTRRRSTATSGRSWRWPRRATERIGLGPAVLVPNLRHPLAQASAIATLEQLAPGRAVVAIGTGFTGRMAMGQTALVVDVHAELRRAAACAAARRAGRGRRRDSCRCCTAPTSRRRGRSTTPIVVAANGPKGHRRRARARRRHHDDRRRQPRLRLVLGARVRHRARRRRGRGLRRARSRPPDPRSRSSSTRCTRRSRRGR